MRGLEAVATIDRRVLSEKKNKFFFKKKKIYSWNMSGTLEWDIGPASLRM